MTTLDVLNKYLYPSVNTNVRRKTYPYYDTLTVVAGQLTYYFFQTALGLQFLRNKQLPLAGSEIFFVNAISAYLNLKITTLAEANAFNELLQQSYLQISVNNRVVSKLPGLDFINYLYSDSFSDQVVVSAVQPRYGGNVNTDGFLGRKLPLPIILNSEDAFEFKFVTTAAAATAFADSNLRLVLHGSQFDKLTTFQWDEVKDKLYSQVPVTYYWTNAISGAAAATYQIFTGRPADNLYSKTFPLSAIESMSIQNIEVFFNQADTPIEVSTAWFSRIVNILRFQIDDVDLYNGDLTNLLSMFAGFGVTLTSTPDLDVVNFTNIRQSKTLPVPIEVPATANALVSLIQPAASLGITGEFTVALRGIESRRNA
jgi:hypothetical protein